MPRLAIFSNLNLSPDDRQAWGRWEIARGMAALNAPDALILNGDLVSKAVGAEAIAFAAFAIEQLSGLALAVPGDQDLNRDRGGKPHTTLDETCLARWRDGFGSGQWYFSLGGWTVIGINAELLDSETEAEDMQEHWLRKLFQETREPAALILHRVPTGDGTVPAATSRLLRMIAASPVQVVVTGHDCVFREYLWRGRRIVAAPAVNTKSPKTANGYGQPGYLTLDLDEGRIKVTPAFPVALRPQEGGHVGSPEGPPMPLNVLTEWQAWQDARLQSIPKTP